MRVAVIGAGAIGSVVGAHLARGGHEVLLVGRGAHVARIKRKGLRVAGLATFETPISATTDPRETEGADLLLFTTKTYDLRAVIESAPTMVGMAAGLQNGVTKDALLAEKFGGERTMGSLTTLGASRPEPGVVQYTFEGLTLFGGPDGDSGRAQDVVNAFEESGLRARVSESILDDEWTKFASWTAGCLISCLTRVEWHRIWTSRHLARAFVTMIREVAAVAKAVGYSIRSVPGLRVADYLKGSEDEAIESVLERGARMVAEGALSIKVSMLQDLEAGKPLELEDTIGHLLKEAERFGTEIPRIALAYRLVQGLAEKAYE